MAKVKFALTPYSLQQEIIDYLDGKKTNTFGEPYRFFVVAIGRQAGKSWLAKYTLLDRAINRKQQCLWVAPSIPTARSHWDDLVKMVEQSGIPVKKISQSAKQIVFKDGGEISVRSAVEPDNMRGLTIDYAVLDEAAFYRNGEYVWYSIVLPMVTASRGVVLFTTTPNGRNYLYRLFLQGQRNDSRLYRSWQAPSTVSPYQDPVLLEEIKQSMPEFQYREEFGAEFLADGAGIFAGAQRAATVKMLHEPEVGHSYVAGIDFGFNQDATTFTVIDKFTRRQVYGKRFFNYGTVATIATLKDLLNHWKPDITHVEKNGIGEALFDVLRGAMANTLDFVSLMNEEAKMKQIEDVDLTPTELEFTFTQFEGKLKALHMDNALKRKLVEGLAADIEYHRLTTLEPEPETYGEVQLNEMSTYIRERTPSGMELTYNAQEGSNDDTIAALYLARKGLPRIKSRFEERLEEQETARRGTSRIKKTINPFANRGSKKRTKGRR